MFAMSFQTGCPTFFIPPSQKRLKRRVKEEEAAGLKCAFISTSNAILTSQDLLQKFTLSSDTVGSRNISGSAYGGIRALPKTEKPTRHPVLPPECTELPAETPSHFTNVCLAWILPSPRLRLLQENREHRGCRPTCACTSCG